MEIADYVEHDAVALGELVATGQVSAEELLDVALRQLEAVNPVVNAVIRVMEDEARDRLTQLDGTASPLRGVPYLLKDLTAMYAGVPTTHGSRFLSSFVPDYDTELVRRLKNAGLVIFGKTNTPEFGGAPTTEPALHGPTRNPWKTSHSAGGSSGGSAAAVAAGIVPAAHASDGGGSIRVPASCCGLFGLKPSRGRYSMGPAVGEIWSGMSIEHALTRTVRDSATLLDIVAGPVPGDPYFIERPGTPFADEVGRDPGRLRIAASAAVAPGIDVHPDVLRTYRAAVEHLRGLGHEVEEVAPTYDAAATSAAILKIIGVNYARTIARHAERIGREPEEGELEHAIEYRRGRGAAVPATEYLEAVEALHRAGRDVASFMASGYDLMLRPTVAQPPPPLGYLDMNTKDLDAYLERLWSYIPYTSLFNATGQPAASVPFGRSADGLPVGIQFAAAVGDESLLFRLAGQLEATAPWATPATKAVA